MDAATMEALVDLIVDLDRAGVQELVAEGDTLRFRPRSALTPDLAERLRLHKPGLLTILRAAEAPDGAPVAGACHDAEAADCVPWPAALADWALLLAPGDLPERFTLRQGVEVVDPAQFLASLRRDIRRGPSGPRARHGALQRDVADLRRILIGRGEPARPKRWPT